jgi:hypothetical protein
LLPVVGVACDVKSSKMLSQFYGGGNREYPKKTPTPGADQGFQVGGGGGGGALKKFASSGGRREKFWGISCEKTRRRCLLLPVVGVACDVKSSKMLSCVYLFSAPCTKVINSI